MATFLMTPPRYYNVQYVINPWMQNQIGKVDANLAQQQWQFLYDTLQQYADIALIEPMANLPDLVFTANAGTIKNNTAIISHFYPLQRQGEEPVYKKWFLKQGFTVRELPPDIYFEGAGDALFQTNENWLWMGHGFRSQYEAHTYLAEYLQTSVITLKLIDPHFYHLDTCLCPLDNGHVLYYPPAFDESSQQVIHNTIAPEKQIMVNKEDANQFACNAITIEKPKNSREKIIILNAASDVLQKQLNAIGYQVVITPTTEYIRAGGATKCMTLQIR